MNIQTLGFLLSLRFLITFTLVLAGFIPLLYSIRKTYLAGKEEYDSEYEHEQW